MSEAERLNKTRIVRVPTSNSKSIAALKKKIKSQVEKAVFSRILNPETWEGSWKKTVRRNGDIVEGDFRDILDTGAVGDPGALATTLKVVWRGNTLVITSDSPYIEAVLVGHEYLDRLGDTRVVPGRNFLDLRGVKLG